MTDTPLCIPFGKYKGEHVDAVPASYLLWCADRQWISRYPRIENYIRVNKKELKMDAEAEEFCDREGLGEDDLREY